MLSYFYKHERIYSHPLLAVPEALALAIVTPFYALITYLKQKDSQKQNKLEKSLWQNNRSGIDIN